MKNCPTVSDHTLRGCWGMRFASRPARSVVLRVDFCWVVNLVDFLLISGYWLQEVSIGCCFKLSTVCSGYNCTQLVSVQIVLLLGY